MQGQDSPIWFGSIDGGLQDTLFVISIGDKARAQFRRAGIVIVEFEGGFDEGGAVPAYEEENPNVVPPHICELVDKRRMIADRRCTFMNAILGALHSCAWTQDHTGYISQEPINPGNWLVVENYSGNLGVTINDHPGKKPLLKPLSEIAVRRAAAVVEASLKISRGDGWQLLSLLYVASFQYSKHQFASSMVTSWSVIEAMQNLFWEDLLRRSDTRHGGHTKINKERRNALLTGREYTASVVSQVLSLCRSYPDVWLEALNQIRKARNAFVHDLTDPGAGGAGDALGMANTMMSALFGQEISFPIAYRLTEPRP